jgi:hypothetical protein
MSGLAALGAKLAIFTAENSEPVDYLLIVLMPKRRRRQSHNPVKNYSAVINPRSAIEFPAA